MPEYSLDSETASLFEEGVSNVTITNANAVLSFDSADEVITLDDVDDVEAIALAESSVEIERTADSEPPVPAEPNPEPETETAAPPEPSFVTEESEAAF